MGKVFYKNGPFYQLGEEGMQVVPTLDDGIYSIMEDPVSKQLGLERVADKFEFGFKLYGLDEVLIKHVIDTYNKQETKRNIGVLLNGTKGTGKTVTAKYLANKLGLPIIICDKPYKNLVSFISSINHDCVFFFDEFEKSFSVSCPDDNEECAGRDLLSVMDGVASGNNCHVFLLTTNELKINDNLISRPSRIRYLKSFKRTLSRNVMEEYIDDNLDNKEFKDEIIEFVESLSLATIDIIKSIVDEVNLHNCHVAEFKSFFNVREANYKYFTKYLWFPFGTYGEKPISFMAAESVFDEKKDEVRYDYISTTKPIRAFKVGDILDYRYKIEALDTENGMLVLSTPSSPGFLKYLMISNMDARPNVFESNDDDDDYYYDY